jgi:hypothetical protein
VRAAKPVIFIGMGVLSILTEDFLDSLPDDDPQAAFVLIVRRCEEYLREQLQFVNDSERGSWEEYTSEQYTVMRTIISSAQRLDIEPFKDTPVPLRKGFDNDSFAQFKHDLDHYLTQFVLDQAIREKRQSVGVAPPVKDRLRSHIHAMRSQIDGAAMSDSKRARLHAKLSEFEAALEKDRIPIFKMASILIEIISLSAGVVGLAESHIMAKLSANIMETFAEAKAADDESRRPLQIDHQRWIALPPKRLEVTGPRESFSADLDDEIPF